MSLRCVVSRRVEERSSLRDATQRCKQENINFQAELDTLLNCSLFELPEQVRKKRLEAFPIEDKNAHIGHNLSLLWEDPHFLQKNPGCY